MKEISETVITYVTDSGKEYHTKEECLKKEAMEKAESELKEIEFTVDLDIDYLSFTKEEIEACGLIHVEDDISLSLEDIMCQTKILNKLDEISHKVIHKIYEAQQEHYKKA